MQDKLRISAGRGIHPGVEKCIRVISLLAACVCGFSPAQVSGAVSSADYFPLEDNNAWTFLVDGFFTNTVTVLPGTTTINGVPAKALESSDDGGIIYFTNDANGIREHAEFDPLPPASTVTYGPPLVFANALTDVSDVVNGAGTAALSIPDISSTPFNFSYTSTSVVEAFETISVPAGSFDTVRIRMTIRIFGSALGETIDETSVQTIWLAKHIGLVKVVFSDSEETETSELTSTNVTPPVFKDDIVIDFGGIGLWSRMNDASWLKLSNSSPDQVVTGDVDGNGEDDVIADLASTLGGIFIKRNLGGWTQLHNFSAELMAVGDLDNNGKDDVVVDFGGIGLWARMNDASWLKLHNSSPDQVVVGDMDGNGADDVIAAFGSGIFVKRNLGGWSQLHNSAPDSMAVGDLDDSGKDDVVIDFGGSGLWARMNDASWLKLHNSSPELTATGDIDGNGADDVLATFAGQGLWQKLNLGGWSKLNNSAPDALVTGDVNGSGSDDIIADFGSTLGGIFVKRDQGAWVKLNNTSPDSMATGELDGQ